MPDPDIDLRGVSGDIRFECPNGCWGVTLKPEGADLWTKHWTIEPVCTKCGSNLTRKVIK